VLIGLDMHVRREIAVKTLLGEDETAGSTQPGSTPAGARFLREARLTAQLEHPGIVPIYEVGRRADGTLYYTMRLVRGRSLAAALTSSETMEDRLRLLHHFADMCGAVAFAHNRGVVHRDLKPQNVMIGEYAETVLIDWGLAKVKSEKENRHFERRMETLRQASINSSLEGAALGTPEFMPPEQAFGDISNIDEPSDVYSLGAVLYNLLTGRPPFEGSSPIDVLLKVQRYGQGKESIVPVRDIAPNAPPELIAIANKALHREPEQRYQSATEILEDINAFREGRKVSAYHYTRKELVRRFLRKHRALVGVTAALFVVLFCSTAALASAWSNQKRASHKDRWDISAGLVEKAEAMTLEGDLLGARIYAAAALLDSRFNPNGQFPDPSSFGSVEADAALVSLQSTLMRANHLSITRHVASFANFDSEISLLEFSPDGNLLATAGVDLTVRVWKVSNGEIVSSRVSTAEHIHAIAWAPDGKRLALGEDEDVKVWNVVGAEEPTKFGRHSAEVTALSYSPDGTQLASSSKDGSICLWGVESQKCDTRLQPKGDESYPTLLRFDRSGKQMISGGPSRHLHIWDVPSGTIRETVSVFHSGVAIARVGEDNSIWALDNDNQARRLNPETRIEDVTIHLGAGRPWIARIRLVGDPLIAVARGVAVELWDPHSGRRLEILRAHTKQVRSLSFSPDGKLLASSGMDGRINLWDISRGSPVMQPSSCTDGVTNTMQTSPDGTRMVSGNTRGQLRLWDLRAARTERTWNAHSTGVEFVAHAPDATIVSAARDGSVRRWNPEDASLLGEFRVYEKLTAHPPGFALSLDGRLLAAGDAGFEAHLWSVDRGERLRSFVGHQDRVMTAAFSPDGATLATGAGDRSVRLWNVLTGQQRLDISVPDTVHSVAFAPNGTLLAESDHSLSIGLFDVATGNELTRFGTRDHHPARSLVFSPDGTYLASAHGSDGRISVWAIPSGRLIEYIDMPAAANDVAFLPKQSDIMAIPRCADFRFVAYRDVDVLQLDPLALLRQAERDAGVRLERFALVPHYESPNDSSK